MTIAMILGALAFLVCLGLIAFGGDDSPSEPTSVTTTSAIAQTSTDQANAEQPAPAQSAPVQATEPATESDQTATEEPVEAEPATQTATEEPVEAEPATQTATEEPVDATTDQPPIEAETSTVDNGSAQAPEVPDVLIESPPVPPGASQDTGYSVLSNGKIFLRGIVPTTEVANQIVGAVEQVMGPGNVINEYVIDPTEPFDPNRPTPVFIDDTITFASGSAEIAPDFYPLIATAPVLLNVQPSVVVTITGHTDSAGTEESNLVLSQARVDAVRDWVISQGGDPERLIAIGKGESEPVADNDTAEGRQTNRRVEFLIEGFDFTLGG